MNDPSAILWLAGGMLFGIIAGLGIGYLFGTGIAITQNQNPNAQSRLFLSLSFSGSLDRIISPIAGWLVDNWILGIVAGIIIGLAVSVKQIRVLAQFSTTHSRWGYAAHTFSNLIRSIGFAIIGAGIRQIPGILGIGLLAVILSGHVGFILGLKHKPSATTGEIK
jgi:hypothetical protein